MLSYYSINYDLLLTSVISAQHRTTIVYCKSPCTYKLLFYTTLNNNDQHVHRMHNPKIFLYLDINYLGRQHAYSYWNGLYVLLSNSWISVLVLLPVLQSLSKWHNYLTYYKPRYNSLTCRLNIFTRYITLKNVIKLIKLQGILIRTMGLRLLDLCVLWLSIFNLLANHIELILGWRIWFLE